MRIRDIHAKGYAGATMGGTSFMVNIEVPKGRFPNLEKNGNDGYLLNIVVPNKEYGTHPKFSLVTKLIDKEDGSISLWGEEETFNEKELQIIKEWYFVQNIEGQVQGIKNEIKDIRKRLDQKRKEFIDVMNKPFETLEEYQKNQIEHKGIEKELEALNQRYEVLNGRESSKKEIEILDIDEKSYSPLMAQGVLFMVNIVVPEDRFPEVNKYGGYLLEVMVPDGKYSVGTKPSFSLSTKWIKEDGSFVYNREDERFTKKELQIIKDWYRNCRIGERAALILEEAEDIKKQIKEKNAEFYVILNKKTNNIEEAHAQQDELDRHREEMDELQKKYDRLKGSDE